MQQRWFTELEGPGSSFVTDTNEQEEKITHRRSFR
jgi:hypothetical protein